MRPERPDAGIDGYGCFLLHYIKVVHISVDLRFMPRPKKSNNQACHQHGVYMTLKSTMKSHNHTIHRCLTGASFYSFKFQLQLLTARVCIDEVATP